MADPRREFLRWASQLVSELEIAPTRKAALVGTRSVQEALSPLAKELGYDFGPFELMAADDWSKGPFLAVIDPISGQAAMIFNGELNELANSGWDTLSPVDPELSKVHPGPRVAAVLKRWMLLIEKAEPADVPQGDQPRNEAANRVQTASAMISSADLALKYHVDPEALRKRLGRWRRSRDDGYVEVSNLRPQEPKFLYDEEAVMPVIEDLKASGTSATRPAEKKSGSKEPAKQG
jgi:hypothetical protein